MLDTALQPAPPTPITIINEDYSYQVDGERPIYNILNEELPKMRTRAEYHGTIAKSLRNPAVFYAMTYNFTGETDEYGRRPRMEAFTLEAVEYLVNLSHR